MKQWCKTNGIDPRLYGAWVEMRRRCRAVRHEKNYAARGITVCRRWHSFHAFATDMGPHPGRGWTLDRMQNNRGYSKVNCRWALYTTQNRNRRSTKMTPALVRFIRATRITQHRLAAQLGCSQPTISEIRNYQTWVDIA